jgi:murein DD-endopeptidase MepM/ murein hydrolase activator NlpD
MKRTGILLFGLILLGFAGISYAQILAVPIEVDETEFIDEEYAEEDNEGESDSIVFDEDYYAFIQTIPCADLYDKAWDSMNLNVPAFRKEDIAGCFHFELIDSQGCSYTHPIYGPITSNFGWRRYRMHKGVDIDLNTGDSVYSAFDGVVRIAKYNYGGFGNYVVVRHYNGLETLYGHLSSRLVEPNQVVRAGEVIGLGGNTGRSTGSHLHFEVRFRGQAVDPNKVIDFENACLQGEEVELDMEDFKYLLSNSAAVATGTGTSSGKVYHRLKYGDTLWSLSRRYGTSVNSICRLNGISTRTTLRAGRTLRIR